MGKPGKGNSSGRGSDHAGEPVTATTSSTASGVQAVGAPGPALETNGNSKQEQDLRAAIGQERVANTATDPLDPIPSDPSLEQRDLPAHEEDFNPGAAYLASLTKADALRVINAEGRDAYTGAPLAAELQLEQIFAFRFTREKLTVVTVDGRKFIVTREGR
jgi:hypothetical protein